MGDALVLEVADCDQNGILDRQPHPLGEMEEAQNRHYRRQEPLNQIYCPMIDLI